MKKLNLGVVVNRHGLNRLIMDEQADNAQKVEIVKVFSKEEVVGLWALNANDDRMMQLLTVPKLKSRTVHTIASCWCAMEYGYAISEVYNKELNLTTGLVVSFKKK